MEKTFRIMTLGCKVNQYDSQCLREQLMARGYRETEGKSDVYIINTCTVTEKSERKSRRLLRKAIEQNPPPRIVVTGCHAQLKPGDVAASGDSLLVAGNPEKEVILDFLTVSESGGGNGNSVRVTENVRKHGGWYCSAGISFFKGHNRAFVKIQDGCDHFCSYCVVPYVRGKSRSREAAGILEEVRRVAKNGIKEIVLTGINLGSFGSGSGTGLVELVNEIERVDGIGRIRLSSIEPMYVTDGLIGKIAESPLMCRHLAVPLQSGDDGVLRRMNRDYCGLDYLALVEKIRLRIPEISITTDCMVGFPGESEENFENTLDIVRKTMPGRMHIFPYSRRPGTAAAEMGNGAAPGEVRERISRLRKLSAEIARNYRGRFKGKICRVLVESRRDKQTGRLTGYTDNYIKVVFDDKDELMNEFVPVRIVDPGEEFAAGEVAHGS